MCVGGDSVFVWCFIVFAFFVFLFCNYVGRLFAIFFIFSYLLQMRSLKSYSTFLFAISFIFSCLLQMRSLKSYSTFIVSFLV